MGRGSGGVLAMPWCLMPQSIPADLPNAHRYALQFSAGRWRSTVFVHNLNMILRMA